MTTLCNLVEVVAAVFSAAREKQHKQQQVVDRTPRQKLALALP